MQVQVSAGSPGRLVDPWDRLGWQHTLPARPRRPHPPAHRPARWRLPGAAGCGLPAGPTGSRQAACSCRAHQMRRSPDDIWGRQSGRARTSLFQPLPPCIITSCTCARPSLVRGWPAQAPDSRLRQRPATGPAGAWVMPRGGGSAGGLPACRPTSKQKRSACMALGKASMNSLRLSCSRRGTISSLHPASAAGRPAGAHSLRHVAAGRIAAATRAAECPQPSRCQAHRALVAAVLEEQAPHFVTIEHHDQLRGSGVGVLCHGAA